MTTNSQRDDEPNPKIPTPPPPPPPTPLPPLELKTVWDVAKIVIFVVVWYVTSDANRALTAYVDYAKIAADAHSIAGASWHGASIGILQGLIMSVQALVVIWASPTMFIYLGPVLTAALQTPIKLVAEFRRALSPKTSDGGDKKADSDKSDSEKSDREKSESDVS